MRLPGGVATPTGQLACRDLAFQGNTGKSTVVLMPTVHCLVQLVEAPYTVVPLADVEIVNLERVGFNGKTFDLVVIFKDFARDVQMIGSIPTQALDDIKGWLNTQDIKFFESKLNLQWKQILKTIVADPDEFMTAVRCWHPSCSCCYPARALCAASGHQHMLFLAHIRSEGRIFSHHTTFYVSVRGRERERV